VNGVWALGEGSVTRFQMPFEANGAHRTAPSRGNHCLGRPFAGSGRTLRRLGGEL